MCNFSKKGDKTESFLAMTVVAAEQLIQKHGPKYPAIHFRHKNTELHLTASLRETTQLQFNSPKSGKPSS